MADDKGPLAREIERLTKAREPITEAVSEQLAAQYLDRNRINEQIRDAGDQLSRELESVTQAISEAQKSNEAYGRTLAGASEQIAAEQTPPALKRMVDNLTAATHRVQAENSTLESKLTASTEEVHRLRAHLEQVRRDSMTDALTNLPNRRYFAERLEAGLAAATRRALGSRHRSSALAQEKTGEFWVASKTVGGYSRGDFEHCEVGLFIGKNPWHSHSIPRARVTLREISRAVATSLVRISNRR